MPKPHGRRIGCDYCAIYPEMENPVGYHTDHRQIPYKLQATQVRGGYDVEISATDGHRIFPQAEISADGTRCTLHVRDHAAPRIGQRVCVHRMLVKVADVRFDQSGRLMVMDEDTGAWLPWEG